MALHPTSPYTANLNVSIPLTLREKLDKLAARSGMSLSAYVRLILEKAAQQNTVYQAQEVKDSRTKV